MTSCPVSPETSNSLIRAWLRLYKNSRFGAIPAPLSHLPESLENSYRRVLHAFCQMLAVGCFANRLGKTGITGSVS